VEEICAEKCSTFGTSEASAVLDVTDEPKQKRLSKQCATFLQHPSQSPAIPSAEKSQQIYLPLHRDNSKKIKTALFK